MAVSEETLPQRRWIRIARPGRKFVVFIFSSVLGVGLAVRGALAYHHTLVRHDLPGGSIAGLDVDGPAAALPAVDGGRAAPSTVSGVRDEAQGGRAARAITTESARKARDAAQLMSADLRLASGKLRWTIRAATLRTWISFVSTADGYRPV